MKCSQFVAHPRSVPIALAHLYADKDDRGAIARLAVMEQRQIPGWHQRAQKRAQGAWPLRKVHLHACKAL